MLTALRPMSIGDRVFDTEDPIPLDVQASLPPGRLVALTAQRYVEERDSLPERMAELEARVSELEAAAKAEAPKRQTRKAA